MRLERWSVLAVVLLAISVYGSPVHADSIGPDGCAGEGCFGGIWTLEYEPAGGTSYNIFYTVDTTGMTESNFGKISQIAFKIASSVVSAAVTSSPAGWGASILLGGLDNNGCSGSGSGFVCSDGAVDLTVPNGTYEWEFLVDIGNAALLTGDLATCSTDQDCASIKANGTVNGKVLSQNITLQLRDSELLPVPEPTTLLLVGTVLVGIGAWTRKQWLGRKVA
jgi:hypothetical protein